MQSVLSAQACKDLNLVQRVNSVIDSSVISDVRPDILLEYPDLFHGLGCLPGKHTIRIDPTVVPVVHPPRKVPVALKGRIKDEKSSEKRRHENSRKKKHKSESVSTSFRRLLKVISFEDT